MKALKPQWQQWLCNSSVPFLAMARAAVGHVEVVETHASRLKRCQAWVSSDSFQRSRSWVDCVFQQCYLLRHLNLVRQLLLGPRAKKQSGWVNIHQKPATLHCTFSRPVIPQTDYDSSAFALGLPVAPNHSTSSSLIILRCCDSCD